MALTPDSAVSIELKNSLTNELCRRYEIESDDAKDISEYVVYCIIQGKSTEDIVVEVKEVAGIPIDTQFVQQVYVEIENIERRANQGDNNSGTSHTTITQSQHHVNHSIPTSQISQDLQHQQPSIKTEVQSSDASASQVTNNIGHSNTQTYPPVKKESPTLIFSPLISYNTQDQNKSSTSTFPAGPKALTDKERLALRSKRFGITTKSSTSSSSKSRLNTGGGVGKKPVDRSSHINRSSQATKHLEEFISTGGKDTTNNFRFIPRPPKGRCPDFPNCTNKQCHLAHPTRNCFAYPNCPHPPGVCNYLHPDQDQELIEKLDQSNKEYQQKQANLIMVQQGSCRFGLKCAKENCPFAHPTPSNPDAKIETLDWCTEGVNCQNKDCTKSHPRPSNTQAQPLPSMNQIALEQCKFGMSCTNYKCPRRHATSAVPCRSGAECKRLDCTFNHPLAEPCRFGINCASAMCMYQHPEGRTVVSHHWTKDEPSGNGGVTNFGTNSRQFAVNEDQVMEQVVQD